MSETSKRAEYYFAKSAVSVDVAKACLAASSLNPAFKPAADYFSNRTLYFLSLAFAEMALRPLPPMGHERNRLVRDS